MAEERDLRWHPVETAPERWALAVAGAEIDREALAFVDRIDIPGITPRYVVTLADDPDQELGTFPSLAEAQNEALRLVSRPQ